MKHKGIPSGPSLDRRLSKVKPLSQIVAFCEGATERRYLDEFATFVGRRLVEVHVVPSVGVPKTVVTRCIEEYEKLSCLARRRNADSFDKQFSVWAVFDRDDHTCYDEAIELALQHDIKLAYSNPCIELWALLHCEEWGDRPTDQHEMQKRLSVAMRGYNHRTAPYFVFSLMAETYAIARARAMFLSKCRHDLQDLYGCPSTSLYELTDFIQASASVPEERKSRHQEYRRRIDEINKDPAYLTGDSQLARERSRLLTFCKEIVG
jgi:hypothetical protein